MELDPFERIVFRWGWASGPLSNLPPGSTVVTVHLRPDGDATGLTLTHDMLAKGERDIHEAGWSLYQDRLVVVVVEGGDPGPDPSLQGAE